MCIQLQNKEISKYVVKHVFTHFQKRLNKWVGLFSCPTINKESNYSKSNIGDPHRQHGRNRST